MEIIINYENCVLTSCYECLDVCPNDVFTVRDEKLIVRDIDSCYRCLVCQDICSYDAIKVLY